MAVKKRSMKGKGTYAVYARECRREKNRNAKLKRHLKRHENDKQAAVALGKQLDAKARSKNKYGQTEVLVTLRDLAGNVIHMPDFGRSKVERT